MGNACRESDPLWGQREVNGSQLDGPRPSGDAERLKCTLCRLVPTRPNQAELAASGF
jgi:hypothetical protein